MNAGQKLIIVLVVFGVGLLILPEILSGANEMVNKVSYMGLYLFFILGIVSVIHTNN